MGWTQDIDNNNSLTLKRETEVKKAIFFDVETTGLSRKSDRLVQLAWILGDLNGETELACRDFIIKPEGFQIPKRVSQIHGIDTDTALKNGVELRDVLEIFKEDMAQAEILIGHNVSFDIEMISSELNSLQLDTDILEKPSICTMRLSTAWCRLPKFNGGHGFKFPKLQELYFKLFGAHFDGAHDALADIRATQKCYKELVKRKIIVIPPDILSPQLESEKNISLPPNKPLNEFKANPDLTNKMPKSFFKAIEENDIDAVLAGIKSGIDITSTYYEGMPPIHWAFFYESFQTLDILLESGASLNQRALDGSNVYHVCSMKTLDLIDEISIDIDARNLLGITPLHRYCYCGKEPELIKSLILRGANPHAKCPFGRKALEWMFVGGNDPGDGVIADEILEPTSQHGGFSAMHFAASSVYSDDDFKIILNILLENGLDINEQDQFGQTPLMLAGTENFDSDVPATLLQNGANLEMKDNDGNTVLHLLCAKEFYLKLEDKKTYIDWHIKRFKNFLSSVKDLQKIIQVENDMGLTPLDCLCKNPEPGSVVFIKPLIEAGANPFHQNKFGKSSWDLMLNLPHFRNSQTFWEINQKRYT